MSIKIDFTFDEYQIAKLTQIPELLRLGPAERCLKAMAKPIAERAKALAPSSQRSGSRKKWSAKFKNDAKWQVDSGKQMGIKTIRHNKGARVYIGAKWPKGNKQQFDASPKGRRHILWGRDTGRLRPRDNPHFLQKAYDETKSQQLKAFNDQLAIEIKELRLG